MQKINENSFIQIFSKPIKPRLIKVQEMKRQYPIEIPSKNFQDSSPKTSNKKNKSISFYEQKKSSSNSLKLPSIYKNHMKYFLNEENLKKSNKRKSPFFKSLNERNPSYILYK